MLQRLKKTITACVPASVGMGVIIHGMMLFNKNSWHDDAGLITNGVGVTFSSGRWFLEYMGGVVKWMFGQNASLPVMHGISSLFLIGLTAALICAWFQIESLTAQILIAALFASFPTVTATFAYMFTAGYYFFACFLSTVGALCILNVKWRRARLKTDGIWAAAGILCMGLAAGIYQAYFVFGLSVVYLGILVDALEDGFVSADFLKKSLFRAFSVVMAICAYLLLNRIILRLNNLELSGYEGLNSIDTPSAGRLLNGIPKAFLAFWGMVSGNYMGFYGSSLVRISATSIIVMAVVLFAAALSEKKREQRTAAALVFLCAPVVFNSIEIFTANGDGFVHGLMVYSSLFSFVLPMILMGRLARENSDKKSSDRRLGGRVTGREILKHFLSALMVFLILSFSHLDNLCYTKAYLYQEQAQQYYNRLITRIESTEGYRPGMPVWLWGTFSGDTYVAYDDFDDVKVTGYDGFGAKTMINNWDYDLCRFLPVHNGYPVNLLTDTSGITLDERCYGLSTYPKAGCMLVIDGVLVVRLSE